MYNIQHSLHKQFVEMPISIENSKHYINDMSYMSDLAVIYKLFAQDFLIDIIYNTKNQKINLKFDPISNQTAQIPENWNSYFVKGTNYYQGMTIDLQNYSIPESYQNIYEFYKKIDIPYISIDRLLQEIQQKLQKNANLMDQSFKEQVLQLVFE